VSGLALEGVCAAIALAFVVPWVRRGPRPLAALGSYLLLAVAAWLGEATCIHAYGFYAYSSAWTLFVGPVPALVALIWPVVILSARDLARALAPGASATRVALLTAGVVLADAALIEPVAVRAGLWTWSAPGPFAVPPIGVLGWAFFTVAAALALERARLLVALAPVVTHALLVAAWWGALRWVSGPWPVWPVVAGVWLASLGLTWRALVAPRVPAEVVLRRAPGALFFFGLLAARGDADVPLVAFALAFAPPYLALLVTPRRRPGPPAATR
jgi:hypothetical protein